MLLLVIGILLAIFGIFTRKRYNLILGVSVVFFVMAFQSNVLSDYQNYLESYNYMQQSGNMDVRTVEDEPLWAGIFWLFSSIFPFWFFIVFLAAVECLVLYIFIRRYCKNSNMWLAAVLFYFTFNMMLLQMYVIRQSFAISFVLLAFLALDKKKKLLLPLVIALLAFLIHNSSVVALPFLILYYFYEKKDTLKVTSGKFGKLTATPIILTALFFGVYMFKDMFLNQYLAPLSMAMDEDFRLAGYLNADSSDGMSNMFIISPLIAIYDGIIVFLVSWFARDASRKMQVFCIISICVAFGDMLLFGIGSIPRILMYLALFNLPVYTAMVTQTRKQFGGIWSLLLIVLLIGYAVKTSLPWLLGTDGDQFGNYKFIFMP